MAADSSRELVDRHEAALDPGKRRRLGAHYTPEDLARRIVDLGWRALGREPRLTCDPSCGAGSVLLAAADRLASAGVPPAEVVQRRLLGVEVDPAAARTACAALEAWAVRRGAQPGVVPNVVVADSLLDDLRCSGGLASQRPDLVCGNPPFLSQLSRTTAFDGDLRRRLTARWPELGAYTDAAAVHLLAAVEAAGDDAVVALLQPQSVLASRDAAPVRKAVEARGALVCLWASGRRLFEGAEVHVCVPVVRLGGPRTPAAPTAVELSWEDDPPRAVPGPVSPERWGALLAIMSGVPTVSPTVQTRPLKSLAGVTAGFRDEFYALARSSLDGPNGGPRLVSVGMIDPAELKWDRGTWRVGGRRLQRPVVDMDLLELTDARVAGWARRRLRPKLLVATQTRVLEVVEDRLGECLPLTPVIAVEPGTQDGSGEEVSLATLAAALSAPSTSAALAAMVAGTGLSAGVLRPSAKVLGELPVPTDEAARSELHAAWEELRCSPRGRQDWWRFSRLSDSCFGLSDEAIIEWWWDGISGRRRRKPVGGLKRA